MSTRKKVILISCILVVCVALIFAVYKYFEIQQINEIRTKSEDAIESRVHVGDERGQALLSMQDAGAWYHGTCGGYKGYYQDIYVFGPKNRQEAVVWDIMSETDSDGRVVVYKIGRFGDSMGVPEECTPTEVWR